MTLLTLSASLALRAADKALRTFSSAESVVNSINRPQLPHELDPPPRTRVIGILSRKRQPLQVMDIF